MHTHADKQILTDICSFIPIIFPFCATTGEQATWTVLCCLHWRKIPTAACVAAAPSLNHYCNVCNTKQSVMHSMLFSNTVEIFNACHPKEVHVFYEQFSAEILFDTREDWKLTVWLSFSLWLTEPVFFVSWSLKSFECFIYQLFLCWSRPQTFSFLLNCFTLSSWSFCSKIHLVSETVIDYPAPSSLHVIK